jgi:cell division protein FtsL
MDAKEARLRTAILIVLVILGVIVILFFISLIRQQRRNLELQSESRQVEVNALEKHRNFGREEKRLLIRIVLASIEFAIGFLYLATKMSNKSGFDQLVNHIPGFYNYKKSFIQT